MELKDLTENSSRFGMVTTEVTTEAKEFMELTENSTRFVMATTLGSQRPLEI